MNNFCNTQIKSKYLTNICITIIKKGNTINVLKIELDCYIICIFRKNNPILCINLKDAISLNNPTKI